MIIWLLCQEEYYDNDNWCTRVWLLVFFEYLIKTIFRDYATVCLWQWQWKVGVTAVCLLQVLHCPRSHAHAHAIFFQPAKEPPATLSRSSVIYTGFFVWVCVRNISSVFSACSVFSLLCHTWLNWVYDNPVGVNVMWLLYDSIYEYYAHRAWPLSDDFFSEYDGIMRNQVSPSLFMMLIRAEQTVSLGPQPLL